MRDAVRILLILSVVWAIGCVLTGTIAGATTIAVIYLLVALAGVLYA